MNCESCNIDLEDYLEGKLPADIRLQVEEHLKHCRDCAYSLTLIRMVENVIDDERKLESNPFLSTRVMAAIGEIESIKKVSVLNAIFEKLLKPALITVTLVAALLLGIAAGSLNMPYGNSEQIPDEIAYLNDSYIESLELFIAE